jgi:uncharacterized repeat protein (TIGR01451 family)
MTLRTRCTIAVLAVVAIIAAAASMTTGGSRASAAGPPVSHAAHLFRPRAAYGVGSAPAGANAPSMPYAPTDNLPPGNGDVMLNTTAYLIYWTPNNTIAASYKNLLERFFNDVGGTAFLNIVTQYYGNNGTIQNVVNLGGTWTDTTNGYDAYDSSHHGTVAAPLQDSDIQKEVDAAIAANGWPTGPDKMFFVFTEKGIESCNGGDCTPLVNNKYCAYHSWFGSGSTERIYANMPFVNSASWDCNNTSGTPTDADADREISTTSHELFEAITDPHPNDTWTDGNCGGNVACGEIGDKCSYFFPNAANADGSNLTLHGNPYNVQPEWSNGTFTALGGHANDGCTHAYQPAALTISKNGPGTAIAGNTFDYTINAQSAGVPTAETPHVTDSLDSHLQFQAITKPAGWACTTPAVGSSGSIDCHRTNNSAGTDGSMENGDTASFDVTVRLAPSTPSGSTVGNTGTIAWDGQIVPDNASANSVHLSQSSSTSATVIAIADLAASKTTLGTAMAGTDFSYVINVENQGPSDAQSVIISDSIPAGTTFISVTGSGGFSCSGTGPVTCTKATMTAGAIGAMTLTVHIPSNTVAGTLITNTAGVSSSTTDPNAANNIASVNAIVNTSADLNIAKSGSSSPVAGTDVSYTLTASNIGPSDAASASLSDTLAAGTTFVSLTAPAGWSCTTPSVGAGGTVSCSESSLPASSTGVFTLVVHLSPSAPDGSQLCNTASLSSSTPDPVSINDASSVCGTVRAVADLAVTQTMSKTGSPGKGTGTFTVTLTNNGPSDSQNVTLTINSSFFGTPPPNIVASGGGTCVASGKNVICTWASIPLGGSVTVSVTVSWHSAVGQICDSATATSGTMDPDATNNTNNACLPKK